MMHCQSFGIVAPRSAQRESIEGKQREGPTTHVQTYHDTNPLAQSAVNDEQGPNDPYNAFFMVSFVWSTNRTSTDHHSG